MKLPNFIPIRGWAYEIGRILTAGCSRIHHLYIIAPKVTYSRL